MISEVERTTYAIMAGGHSLIRKSLDAGKPSKEAEAAISEREREEENKRVSPIYDSRGRIVESPADNIRYVEAYREYLKQPKKHVDISA